MWSSCVQLYQTCHLPKFSHLFMESHSKDKKSAQWPHCLGDENQVSMRWMGPGNWRLSNEVIMFGNFVLFVSTQIQPLLLVNFYWFLTILSCVVVFVTGLFMDYESFNILESYFLICMAWLCGWLWIRTSVALSEPSCSGLLCQSVTFHLNLATLSSTVYILFLLLTISPISAQLIQCKPII